MCSEGIGRVPLFTYISLGSRKWDITVRHALHSHAARQSSLIQLYCISCGTSVGWQEFCSFGGDRNWKTQLEVPNLIRKCYISS